MSGKQLHVLHPPDQVLSTLNADGSRRWLRPRVSPGRFLTGRRWVGWGLIAIFALLPLLKMNGKPLLLLDVAHRRFHFFGVTFLSTDTLLLALLLLAAGLSVFFFTALAGRVWCGWACPQTVYMEFLYRPIERLFEGSRGKGGRPAVPPSLGRRLGLFGVYLLVSLLLAHIFLAYFVGAEELLRWMTRSPFEHPGAFVLMAVTTALMLFNFGYFREQTCLVACPYGRFQSVLLDRDSLVISYDTRRGEPRGRMVHDRAVGDPQRGDCIDCGLCVVTCPTGIDIRNGLQMECVACAQCIDACDRVMDKISRPRGLIRYTSQRSLEQGRTRTARGRVLVYGVALLGVMSALVWLLLHRSPLDAVLLRAPGMPFAVLPSGDVQNPFKLRITNRTDVPRRYTVELRGAEGLHAATTWPAVFVAPADSLTEPLPIVAPRSAFDGGRLNVTLVVRDDAGGERVLAQRLLGPVGPSEKD